MYTTASDNWKHLTHKAQQSHTWYTIMRKENTSPFKPDQTILTPNLKLLFQMTVDNMDWVLHIEMVDKEMFQILIFQILEYLHIFYWLSMPNTKSSEIWKSINIQNILYFRFPEQICSKSNLFLMRATVQDYCNIF